MAVSAEWIKKVMGSPDSVTAKLVALRESPGDGPLDTGVWYSNFTRVKAESERRGLPFVAMWTNGDVCGLCRRFTANILDPRFLDWMKSSGSLFWLGGSMDDNDDDRRDGAGYKWCLGEDGHVNYFPFVAVSYVRDGKRGEFFGSGHDYDRRKAAPEGTPLAIGKLDALLRGVAPSAPRPSTRGVSLRIRLNPEWDMQRLGRFTSALALNEGHCVCRPDKTADTLCMCADFARQDRPGLCRCGAFEKYIA